MIAIIDYGMGNVRSVLNACAVLDADAEVTCDHDRIRNARGIILPGVGAFPEGMAALEKRGLIEVLNDRVVNKHQPFLGICLGMQMLATVGKEHGICSGLGWIPGATDLLVVPSGRPDIRLPHIGWNTVRFIKKDGAYQGMGEQADFYYVHSYVFSPTEPMVVSGVSDHGGEFVASVEYENIWATQFHPEKSHKNGLKLIANWLRKVASC